MTIVKDGGGARLVKNLLQSVQKEFLDGSACHKVFLMHLVHGLALRVFSERFFQLSVRQAGFL